MTNKIHSLLNRKLQIKAKKYESEKRFVGFIENIISLIFIIIFYFYFSKPLTEILPNNSILKFVTYILIFMIWFFPLEILFNFLSSYKIEHKYNFSNQNIKSWLWDYFKGFFVQLILTPILLGLLFLLFHFTPEYWWLYGAILMIFVSTILATIFPIVILPIFNKYTPIKDEKLTSRLSKILKMENIKIKGFFKEDMSKQTKKENAFLAGMGKTKRVVLGDNILEKMNVDELETIIAHEVGHYKHKHMLKNIFIGSIFQLLLFFIINIFLRKYFPDFLTSLDANLTTLPIFILSFSFLNTIFISPIVNFLSRHFENQADNYSFSHSQNTRAFITAMAGLANRNLSNAYPTSLIKIFYYSHPPVGERLDNAESYLEKQKAESKK